MNCALVLPPGLTEVAKTLKPCSTKQELRSSAIVAPIANIPSLFMETPSQGGTLRPVGASLQRVGVLSNPSHERLPLVQHAETIVRSLVRKHQAS